MDAYQNLKPHSRSSYVSMLTTSSDAASTSTQPTTVGAPSSNEYLPLNTQAMPTASLSTVQPVNSSGSDTTTGYAAGEWYTIQPSGVVVIGDQTFSTASPTTATLDDGNIVAVGPSGISIQEMTSKPVHTITPHDYYIGAFVPIVLAVIFSIPWHILAAAIREMESFYQLQRLDGALAENSLCLNYRSSISAVATFNATRRGHFVVWWSGLVSIIILFLSPLASETVFIGFVGGGRCTATSSRDACIPLLSVFPAAARAVQGILAFVAVITFFLAIAIARRKSGVFANPLSIAGLATLFQDQDVVEDFRRIVVYSPNSNDIKAALRGQRYRIGAYSQGNGSPEYGITTVHNNAEPADPSHRASFRGKKYTSVAVNAVEERPDPLKRKKQLSRLGTHPAVLLIFGLFVCATLTLIVYYNRVHTFTGFERFMDSESFGTSFLFTAIGVIIKMYWTLLDDGTSPSLSIMIHRAFSLMKHHRTNTDQTSGPMSPTTDSSWATPRPPPQFS